MRRFYSSLVWLALVGAVAWGGFRATASPLRADPPLTFTVDSAADAVDVNVGDGICASAARECTLRAAVMESNATDSRDVINVRADEYVFALEGKDEDGSLMGDLDINDHVIIQGAGASSTIIDANGLDRVFHIIGPFDVRMEGVTLRNGQPEDGEDGGALFNSSNANTLIRNSIVEDNTAGKWGGGLANDDSARLELRQVTVRGNSADLGGGLDNHDGILVIFDSVIHDNTATASSGGGIYNDGTLRVETSHLYNNHAFFDGGGIFNFDSLTVERSTVSGNSADGDAGGILNWGEFDIRNTTVSGNAAGRDAGGIFNLDEMTMIHATVFQNEAADKADGLFNDGFATIQNSVIAENGTENCLRWNNIDSQGNNLENTDTCEFIVTGDFRDTPAQLGALQNNGGFTPTHEPLVGSALIDGGNPAHCLVVDQRDVPRPQGLQCDIGAHEVNEDDLSIKKMSDPATVLAGDELRYLLTVENLGDSDAAGVQVVDALPDGVNFVSANGNGWACGEASGIVTCDKSPVVQGASEVITITLDAPDEGGVITNTATVASETADSIPTNNSTTVTTTVIANTDVTVSATAEQTQVVVGEPMTFVVAVENLGASSAEVVRVDVDIPNGQLQYNGVEPNGWFCEFVNGEYSCVRPSIPVGVAPAITFTVTPLVGDVIIRVPVVVSTSTRESDLSNNSDTVLLGSASMARADLGISISDSPDPVQAAGALQYAIAVDNAGPDTATAITMTQQLDTATTFVSAGGNGWQCDNASGVVTCTRDQLAIGSAPVIMVAVTAPNDEQTLQSSAAISATTVDPNTTNDSDTEVTLMGASADLSLSIEDAPDPVAIGANYVYTMSVGNVGPSAASNIVLTATLPVEANFVSKSHVGWSCGLNGQAMTCQRPTISVGDAPPIVVEVNVLSGNADDLLILNAGVTAASNDVDLSNNTATETTRVGVVELGVALSADTDFVIPNIPFNYTIDVTNAGPNDARNVVVTIALPSALTLLDAMGAGWDCAPAGGNVVCERPTIAANNSAPTIMLTVRSQTGITSITTGVTVTNDRHDRALNNNQTSHTVTVGGNVIYIPIIRR